MPSRILGKVANEPFDPYALLLRTSRGMPEADVQARAQWFRSLSWQGKEAALFELEALMKGVACFGHLGNHPGPRRSTPNVSDDFRPELLVVKTVLERCLSRARKLHGTESREFKIESIETGPQPHGPLVNEFLAMDTPSRSLSALLGGLGTQLAVVDGVLRVGRISHPLFFAVLGSVSREIARNRFFNPLITLEFCPEYDRVRVPAILEALERVPTQAAHHLYGITLLTLGRAMRYLDLIDEYVSDPVTTPLAFAIFAVVRSDLRELTSYLRTHAGNVLANKLEKDLLDADAAIVTKQYDELTKQLHRLVWFRASAESAANLVSIEVQKIFERDLPMPGVVEDADVGPQLVVATAHLRATVNYAVGTLLKEFSAGPPLHLAAHDDMQTLTAERLRREIWMFTQILRAYLAKAGVTHGTSDRWVGAANFQFVRDFLQHFRAIGYQLVRMNDYDRLQPLLITLEETQDVDLLDEERTQRVTTEAEALLNFLERLFTDVSSRAELEGVAFDKREAAETLKVYLTGS